MFCESRVTWEKLCLEIELLNSEDPTSLIPLLLGVQSVLHPDETQEWTIRTINFMSYELAAKCEGLSEEDRFHTLNAYLFDQKGFQVLPKDFCLTDPKPWLIRNVLENRAGASLPMTLIYLHLASHLDLPIYFAKHPRQTILKWVRASKSVFIDLASGATLLSSDRLLELCQNNEGQKEIDFEGYLDILPYSKVFRAYLEKLYVAFRSSATEIRQVRRILDALLLVDGGHLQALAHRALLLKKLGEKEGALADLQRYFSFVDHSASPKELQVAFYELTQGRNAFPLPDPGPENTVLH